MRVIITVALLLLSACNDSGAWEKCREKHSQQVCINILQEVGE